MPSACPRWLRQASVFPAIESLGRRVYLQRLPFTIYQKRRGHINQIRCYSIPVFETSAAGRTVAADERITRLFRHGLENLYPRSEGSEKVLSYADFTERYHDLKNSEARNDEEVVLRGRITQARSASSKLFFFDLTLHGRNMQVLCSFQNLDEKLGINKSLFKARCGDFNRGDIISVKGHPYRTERGQLSIRAAQIPTLLAPCLQAFPLPELARPEKDKQALIEADRHVQLLTMRETLHTIRARAAVFRDLRRFFVQKNFMELDTPILGAIASGATARPFETSATDFPDRRLALRIAPELWLKRLVVGGLEKIFEIGPAFRNEGLDKTHNPEFTTCEFYQAHATLQELMTLTEDLLRRLQKTVAQMLTGNDRTTPLRIPSTEEVAADFPRLDFITSLENGLGRHLPDLNNPDAESQVLHIFREKSLPIPPIPTLPRLLDKLSSIYLEPRCDRPTFIVNHPECMSPLAKSYLDPTTGQKISARAELFIQGREMANMYEEENSPFEQRKKFEKQRLISIRAMQLAAESTSSDTEHTLHESQIESLEPDESYLEALEWGLPPTGGWGCGVDRLIMYLTGRDRISDVLTFGNLRSVSRGHRKVESDLDEHDIKPQI